jgi:hypothetical protein
VNKARLKGGKADTNREWEFLLAAACDQALAAFDTGHKSEDCNERPTRFFDPCIHREGTRLCTEALRAEIAALTQHEAGGVAHDDAL